MNYAKMIEILTDVKQVRLSEVKHSPYVCDNVRFNHSEKTRFEDFADEREAICADIKEYIGGEFSLTDWLSTQNGKYYINSDAPVEKARIEMIDSLIAKYELKVATIKKLEEIREKVENGWKYICVLAMPDEYFNWEQEKAVERTIVGMVKERIEGKHTVEEFLFGEDGVGDYAVAKAFRLKLVDDMLKTVKGE